MFDIPSRKKSDFLKTLNGGQVNGVDHAFLAFAMLGLFDDIREAIKFRSYYKTLEWILDPSFLFCSLVAPCFNCGMILSRKYYFDNNMQKLVNTATKWGKMKGQIMRQYHCLAMVFAAKLLIGWFELVADMTQDQVDKINLQKILPAKLFSTEGVVTVADFSLMNAEVGRMIAKPCPLVMTKMEKDNLSPILRLLPLKLLKLELTAANVSETKDTFFGVANFGINELYDCKKFWWNPGYKGKVDAHGFVNILGPIVPNAWWNDMIGGVCSGPKQMMFPLTTDFNVEFLKLATLFGKGNCFYVSFERHVENAFKAAVERENTESLSPKKSSKKSHSKTKPKQKEVENEEEEEESEKESNKKLPVAALGSDLDGDSDSESDYDPMKERIPLKVKKSTAPQKTGSATPASEKKRKSADLGDPTPGIPAAAASGGSPKADASAVAGSTLSKKRTASIREAAAAQNPKRISIHTSPPRQLPIDSSERAKIHLSTARTRSDLLSISTAKKGNRQSNSR